MLVVLASFVEVPSMSVLKAPASTVSIFLWVVVINLAPIPAYAVSSPFNTSDVRMLPDGNLAVVVWTQMNQGPVVVETAYNTGPEGYYLAQAEVKTFLRGMNNNVQPLIDARNHGLITQMALHCICLLCRFHGGRMGHLFGFLLSLRVVMGNLSLCFDVVMVSVVADYCYINV